VIPCPVRESIVRQPDNRDQTKLKKSMKKGKKKGKKKTPSSSLCPQHDKFVSYISQPVTKGEYPRFKKSRYHRTIGVARIGDINSLLTSDEILLDPPMKLHTEAVPFLFHINGCPKNLLLYIVAKRLDVYRGRYAFNNLTIQEFIFYAKDFFGTTYTTNTVKQAHRELIDYNVCLNVKQGEYFLNPRLAGGKGVDGRRALEKEYTELLKNKGLDHLVGLYPVYLK
jgi:hypothetical protein